MVGVDVALTQFVEQDAQRAAVQAMLDGAINARLCVSATASGATIDVALANHRVGHGWPSGSNQDRRAWVELAAKSGATELLHVGSFPVGTPVNTAADPLAFVLRDHDFDKSGAEVELFAGAVTYTSAQLPAEVTSNVADPRYDNAVHKSYDVAQMPDQVTMQVNIRPLDYDLIEAVVKSGDLDPGTIAPLSTFTLAQTRLEWSASSGPCVGN
jgi:hypothetical protein